jgi:hypothetical protein
MVGTRAGEERKKVQTGEGEKGHKGGRRGKEGGGGEEGKMVESKCLFKCRLMVTRVQV